MTTLQASAQKQLRQFVEQIERLEEEKKALAGDLRDKFLEAKGLGFDVKALRQIVRMRKKSATERGEEEAILEVYMYGRHRRLRSSSHLRLLRPCFTKMFCEREPFWGPCVLARCFNTFL